MTSNATGMFAIALIALIINVYIANSAAAALQFKDKFATVHQPGQSRNYTILNDTINYDPIVVYQSQYITVVYTISAPDTDIYDETIVVGITNNFSEELDVTAWSPWTPSYVTATITDPPYPIGIGQTAIHTIWLNSHGGWMQMAWQYSLVYDDYLENDPNTIRLFTAFPCNGP